LALRVRPPQSRRIDVRKAALGQDVPPQAVQRFTITFDELERLVADVSTDQRCACCCSPQNQYPSWPWLLGSFLWCRPGLSI
jgi:hypothetical protein